MGFALKELQDFCLLRLTVMEESSSLVISPEQGPQMAVASSLPPCITHDLSLWNNSVIPIISTHFTCRGKHTVVSLGDQCLDLCRKPYEHRSTRQSAQFVTITPTSHCVLYPSWLPVAHATGMICAFECFKYKCHRSLASDPALPFQTTYISMDKSLKLNLVSSPVNVKMENSCTLYKWVSWCPGFAVCINQASPRGNRTDKSVNISH